MLFSNDLIKGLKQLQSLLPFGSSYDYDRIFPMLSETELQYLKPLLGETLYQRLIKESETHTTEVRMCQKAIANIVMLQNFATINTQIFSGGFGRMQGENVGSIYKYQETALKDTFRKNGFDTLDLIVEYFLTNITTFPEFKESTYFTETRKQFVNSRFIVGKYYKEISHIVFHHLTPFLNRAETLDVADLIDLSSLRDAMTAEPIPADKKTQIEMVQAVIVLLGVSYAIEDRGVNISQTGVWLESKVAGDGTSEQTPLMLSETDKLVSKYRQLAERYKNKLTKAVDGTGHINPLIRDNTDKKIIVL